MRRFFLFAVSALLAAAVGGAAESALNGGVVIRAQEGVDLVPLTAVTNRIAWAAKPLLADGDLEKWRQTGIRPIPIGGEKQVTTFRGTYQGTSDFSAEVYLAADYSNLYLGIRTIDDRKPSPGRFEIAFADARSALIKGWRDVGQRYSPDDVHFGFSLKGDGSATPTVYRAQHRMDSGALEFACGNETERRALIDSGVAVQQQAGKMLCAHKDGFISLQIPWRTLQPLDPVAGTPFRMNLAIYDDDGTASHVLAFAPGLVGTYSGYHFPVFEMPEPPADVRYGLRASLAKKEWSSDKVAFDVTVRTAAAFEGSVEVASFSLPVKTRAGVAYQAKLEVESAALPAGKPAPFAVRLKDAQGRVVATERVVAPTKDDSVTIFHRATIEAMIAELKASADRYRTLIGQMAERGLDLTYPRAWLAMMDMFVETSSDGMVVRDAPRVIRNMRYFKDVVCPRAFAYAERVLADPSRQWIVPATDPGKLTMRDGYFWNPDGKPVFLWGPCLFWYLRGEAHYAWEMGFNSVGPEISDSPRPSDELLRQDYMRGFYEHKMRINLPVRAPALELTGKDETTSKLLADHPDLKNLDANNFMPFLVQHAAVKPAVDECFRESIAFNNRYRGIGSFWLWNEPSYNNWSPRTQHDFRQALQRRYGGKIENLNRMWRSAYGSFDEVPSVTGCDAANPAPWIEFQNFRNNLLNDFFSCLHATSRKYRPDMPTHVKFMSMTLGNMDLERIQEPFEIIGRDGNCFPRDTLFADFFRCVAPEKPIVDTEVHIWYGGDHLVNSVAWRLALHGLAEANWWCWHSNPRFSDSVRNAESLNALVMSGLDVRRLFADYVHPAATNRPAYAVYFPTAIAGCTSGLIDQLRYDAAPALSSLGERPYFVSERQIARKKALAAEKTLFVFGPTYATEAAYATIRDWVWKGGTLVTVTNAFDRNELGLTGRDTQYLIPRNEGEAYADGMTLHRVHGGRVITLDALASCAPNLRYAESRRIFGIFREKEGLAPTVDIVQTGDKAGEEQMREADYRLRKAEDGAWILVGHFGRWWTGVPYAIRAKHPIRRIVNKVDDTVVYEAKPGEARTEVAIPMDGFAKVYRIELGE